MTRWFDIATSVILCLVSWSEIETIFTCITAAFLLLITLVRYFYKLWQKLRDKKLTKEEREELKQDTAQLIEDTAALVGDLNKNIGALKNGRGQNQDEDTPRE